MYISLRKGFLCKIIVAILCLSFLFACSEDIADQDNDGVIDQIDRCANTDMDMPVDTFGCPILINKIHLVLDNSGSMIGYTSTNSAFKNDLAELLSRIKVAQNIFQNPSIKFDFYTTEGSNHFQKYNKDFNSFTTTLSKSSGGIMKTHNSFLHIALDSLTKIILSEPQSVGIFVTDGILSVSHSRGSETNKTDISQLTAAVTQAIGRLNTSNKDFQIQLYQLKSVFSGKYFTYNNNIKYLKDVTRPYYILVIGEKNWVHLLEQSVLKSTIQTKAGASGIIWSGAYIQPRIEIFREVLEGVAYPYQDRNTIALENVRIDETSPSLQFVLGLDLTGLPMFSKTESYFLQHLKFNSSVVESFKLFEANKFKREYADFVDDNIFWKEFSHYLIIRLSGIPSGNVLKGGLKNSLKQEDNIPEWVKDHTTMDDTIIDTIKAEKTFGLVHLFKAIKYARIDQEKDTYFSFDIKID